MKYSVGQVVFVVLKKENRVMAIQVVEEITKKTIEGEEIAYAVKIGTNAETIALSDVDGEVFESADKLRKTLIERATMSLNRIVDGAVEKSKEWYPSGFVAKDDGGELASVRKQCGTTKKAQPVEAVSDTPLEAADGDLVELGDGTKARIRNVVLPKELDG